MEDSTALVQKSKFLNLRIGGHVDDNGLWVGHAKLPHLLQLEVLSINLHRDLIQRSYNKNYNISSTTLGSMEWLYLFCQIKHVHLLIFNFSKLGEFNACFR